MTEILDGLVDALQYIIGAAAFAVLFVAIWMVLRAPRAGHLCDSHHQGRRHLRHRGVLVRLPHRGGTLHCGIRLRRDRRALLPLDLLRAPAHCADGQARRAVRVRRRDAPGLFAVSGVLFIVKIAAWSSASSPPSLRIASKISVTNDDDECDVSFGKFEIFDIIQFGVCFISSSGRSPFG